MVYNRSLFVLLTPFYWQLFIDLLILISPIMSTITIHSCYCLWHFNMFTTCISFWWIALKYVAHNNQNRIGGVMVSVLAWSVVDREFKPQSGQTKDYKIGICCFFAKHAVLRRNSKDWLARNEWGHMSIRGLLSLWASTIKIQLSVLVWYKADPIIISLKINLFPLWCCFISCCSIIVVLCSVFRNHSPVFSSIMIYHWVCNNGSTTGTTSRAGIATLPEHMRLHPALMGLMLFDIWSSV